MLVRALAVYRFASGSAALDNSSNQEGVLQNVDPSVILDITGAGEKKKEQGKTIG